MDKAILQSALAEHFAPWVQALGLKVEGFDADSVTLRLPQNAELEFSLPIDTRGLLRTVREMLESRRDAAGSAALTAGP